MITPRLVIFLLLLSSAFPVLAQAPAPRPPEDPVVIFEPLPDLSLTDFEEADRARRLDLLAEQLSLDGIRTLIADRIRAEREQAESDLRDMREEEARRAEEARALADAEATLERSPVLRRMLEEAEAARSRFTFGPDPVELAVTSAALGRLLERLDELERADNALRGAEERLLDAAPSEDIVALQERVRRAGGEVETLLRNLAADILDAQIELDLYLSDPQGALGGGLVFEPPEEPVIIAEPSEEPVIIVEPSAPDAPSEVSVGLGGVDPFALLPELFPWPPPRASASAVIRNAFLSENLGADPTLGDVSDLLVGALSDAGYHELSYLGAPGGFALVTRIEQTREDGTPLEDRARWTARIERLKSFSLADILRAIFTAPEGYYRVIALIVTDTPFSERGGETLLSTVETWIGEGVNVLPVAVEALPFTAAHDVTALVYEFRKRTDTDAPSVNLSDPLPAPRHLAHTRLSGGFR